MALKIVVTGPRGFIGSRLLGPLVATGADVTALVRTGHDRARLRASGAQVCVAGLTSGAALVAALAGQDVLVNLAYDVRAGMADNMASFEALMAAAKRAGIRRVVHISSAVVYDGWPDKKIDENSPTTDPADGSYRNAKISMENNLLRGEFEVAILQPTIVYGPDSSLWTKAPMAALAAGGVILPDPVGTCAAVHVDDVVQAILQAVVVSGIGQERFLINGPEQLGWDRFYQGYRDILGQGDIVMKPAAKLLAALGNEPTIGGISTPSAAARVSAVLRRTVGSRRFEAIQATASGLRKPSGPTNPSHSMLALLMAKPKISTNKAREILRYEPQVDFAKGLAGIAEHLQ